MLRTYSCFSKLNTRQLNKDYPLKGYKFTKRGDALTIYKPIEKTDKETNKHESIEDITNRLETLEEQLREHTNKYEHDLITIRTQFKNNINKINEIKDSLNTVINVINQMLNQK